MVEFFVLLFISFFFFFVSHKHVLNVNNANGSALCRQCVYSIVVVRLQEVCRVFVGHIWDNGNCVSVHVTTVQEDADKGLAFNFYFFFLCVFEAHNTIFIIPRLPSIVCSENMKITYDLIHKIMRALLYNGPRVGSTYIYI